MAPTQGKTTKTTQKRRRLRVVDQQAGESKQEVDCATPPQPSVVDAPLDVKRQRRTAIVRAREKLEEMADRDEIEPTQSASRKLRFRQFIDKYIGDPLMGESHDRSLVKAGGFGTAVRKTRTRPGMDVALYLIDIVYREKGGDRSPTGPKFSGIVLGGTISFSGLGFGAMSGRCEGTAGEISRRERTRIGGGDPGEASKYRYETVGTVQIQPYQILSMDVFSESHALTMDHERFEVGDMVMCHGVRLDTRDIDAVSRPDGYTSFSACSISNVGWNVTCMMAGVDILSVASANALQHFKPTRDEGAWKAATERVIANPEMDSNTQSKLMRSAMTSETKDMMAQEVLLQTTATDAGAIVDDGGIVTIFQQMAFPSPTDTDLWKRTKDNVETPRVYAVQLKSQLNQRTGRVTNVHLNVSIPDKYLAPYGIMDSATAVAVLPHLVPKVDAVMFAFVDARDTIEAPVNAPGGSVPCFTCSSIPGNMKPYECCAWSYVAKRVFPKLVDGLIKAASDKNSVRIFEVTRRYAKLFLEATKRTANTGATKRGQKLAQANPLNTVRDGDPAIMNVAESMWDYSDNGAARLKDYRFFVVFGHDMHATDVQTITDTDLASKTPEETTAFFVDKIHGHVHAKQVVFAVKKK